MDSGGAKRLLKTQTFGKKSSLSSEKNILTFSDSIEHDKYQGTI